MAVSYDEQATDFEFVFRSIKENLSKIYDYNYEPTTLIADNAAAITNGFEQVFSQSFTKRVSCWAHVIRNVDGQLKTIKNETKRIQIRMDICNIQSSISKSLFDRGLELFFNKWKGTDQQLNDFMDYFRKQWCQKNEGWYEGFCLGIPSQSNGIESTHRHMKDHDILRSRLAFNQFLNSMEGGLVQEWSIARDPTNPNCKEYHFDPIIATKDWTDAFKWNAKSHKVVQLGEFYYTSESKPKLTRQECADYLESLKTMPWSTFDEMVLKINSIFQLKVNKSSWKQTTCTCSIWQKNYKCSHMIAACCLLQLCDFNTVAMSQPIGMKRRQGRPKQTKSALIRQPSETVEQNHLILSEEEIEVSEPVYARKKRSKPLANKSSKKKK